MKCKFCKSENTIKHGKIKQKQRFFCKDCKKHCIEGDNRKKYDQKIIQTAFILFSECNNYRRIARILSQIFNQKIYYQTVILWIQKKVDEMPENLNEIKDFRDIEVLEMDELYTFIKKNPKKPLSLLKKCPTEVKKSTINTTDNTREFGLLLTATATKLLLLK